MAGDGWFYVLTVLVLVLAACGLALVLYGRRQEERLSGRLSVLEAAQRVLAQALPPGHARQTSALSERVDSLADRTDSLERATTALLDRLTLCERTVTQARERAEQHHESMVALHEALGKALGGFKGLAVHSGPEHTPDLYLASRQNLAGAPRETWRCHYCPYREVRDVSFIERTDLASPRPEAPEEAPAPTPAPPPPPVETARLPKNVLGRNQGLVEVMRGRRSGRP